MKIENSSEHWDRLWTNELTNSHVRIPGYRIIENLIRRQLYFKVIDKLLGSISLEGKDILELGCGTGSNSLYLAKTHKSKSVTLLDFSQKALTRVTTKSYPCSVMKIHGDILKFSAIESYDFVHSTGLVEHFSGIERLLIIEKHSQCARPGGLIMIWVPIFSPVFRYVRKFNCWLGIEETPFTKSELQFLCLKGKLEIIREGNTGFGALYGILARKKH